MSFLRFQDTNRGIVTVIIAFLDFDLGEEGGWRVQHRTLRGKVPRDAKVIQELLELLESAPSVLPKNATFPSFISSEACVLTIVLNDGQQKEMVGTDVNLWFTHYSRKRRPRWGGEIANFLAKLLARRKPIAYTSEEWERFERKLMKGSKPTEYQGLNSRQIFTPAL